jgi:hypothetical protein
MKTNLLFPILFAALCGAASAQDPVNIEKAPSSDKETNSSITFDAELDGYEVILGEPTVVAQAPPEVTAWGPYQFCDVEKLPNGMLRASWHTGQDSAEDHGRVRRAHAVSDDGGRTWRLAEDPFEGIKTADGKSVQSPILEQDTFGTLLPNGDRLTGALQPSMPLAQMDLGESIQPVSMWMQAHGNHYALYDSDAFPEKYRDWKMRRLPKDSTEWVSDHPSVSIPGFLRPALGGSVLSMYVTSPYAKQMDVAPDGSLWIAFFGHRVENGEPWDACGAMFLRSKDAGKSWDFVGQIPYAPTAEDRSDPAKWDGFTEPALTFFPDGSLFCVLRTCDVTAENRPLYWSRSTDAGRTWRQPQVFDRYGVWPGFVRLKNGSTILTFGRPGNFIRISRDPAGLKWSKKFTILDPALPGCANAGLAAISDDTAIIVYSSFSHPQVNSDPAVPVKTILARTITVRPK